MLSVVVSASALLGTVAAISLVRAIQSGLQEKVKGAGEKVQSLAVFAGFWFAVFLAAKYIVLDS